MPACRAEATGSAVSARVTTLDALDRDHGPAWDACVARAIEPNPFVERWFAMAGARHLSPVAPVRAVAAFEGERLIGLLPIVREPDYYRMPLPTTQNWVHANAFLGGPLLDRNRAGLAWSAMLDAIDALPARGALFHLVGLVEDGPAHRTLCAVAADRGRRCEVVQRHVRALLASPLAPDAYYEATVRKKKRKELKRLVNRLGEAGDLVTRRLSTGDDVGEWADAFLTLERSGWKGRAGSALGSDDGKDAFFREALASAHARDRLQILRMELDGRPIAMLVNFLCPPGSFSFKIAFDEDHARFSPGVLIQLDNYAILDDPRIDWMDSCAAENHSMIDSLWAERRSIVRVSIPLAGWPRPFLYSAARAIEDAHAAWKVRRAAPHSLAPPDRGDDDD